MLAKRSSYNNRVYSLIASLIILVFLKTKEVDLIKVNLELLIN